jgi:hypothetical protein
MTMMMRFALIFLILAIIAAVIISGSLIDDELPIPQSTSVDGAVINTGLELDENNQIFNPGDTFKPNQDFYVHFDNNDSFDFDQVTFQLLDTQNDKILAQQDYDVNIEETELYSLVYFSSPGLYRILALVGGQIRATREILIKE